MIEIELLDKSRTASLMNNKSIPDKTLVVTLYGEINSNVAPLEVKSDENDPI